MANDGFLYKIRQLDNRAAQWMARHFYIILFEVILGIIFILAFINVIRLINISFYIPKDDITQQLLFNQSVGTNLVVMVLILISLGVLNVINTNTRTRNVLKNIEFNVSRRRADNRPSPSDD